MIDPELFDEVGRLAALSGYNVLDTAREAPFDKITALVRTLLDVPIATVSLIDENRQWFKSNQGINACETAREVSFCTHTIRSRAPMVVADARNDDRFRDNPLVTGPPYIASYAGAPLTSPGGYNVGALCAMDRVPRDFTPAQIDLLKSFAAMVVDELELRQIAQRDHLTGALTRRALIALANDEILRRDRYQRPSALILFDIDHFKLVNDRLGHASGDEVLKAIARCCGATMRASDVFGRVGGEEFAFVLPETGPTEALLSAERYCRAIGALAIDIGGVINVTASFGVAPLTPDIHCAEAWLARADLSLYASKNNGRNRCSLSIVPSL